MQALMVIPQVEVLRQFGSPEEVLTQEVAGVPLLVRVVATAMRAGVTELVLVWPEGLAISVWDVCLASPALRGLKTREIPPIRFDPRKPSKWAAIESVLPDELLWLPWNFVTSSRALAEVTRSPVLPLNWDKPVLMAKPHFGCGPRPRVTSTPAVEGVSIESPADVGEAERFLVKRSGKKTDGIYSTLNRTLCRPVVRALVHTPITPNAVTVAGLLVAILSAALYAVGAYWSYIAGALLFFLSGLVDEMDGMVARLKFLESAFGTWFEGFVDNVTYLLLFSGMTAGLYRERGRGELVWGVALVAGCVLSSIVVAAQRKALAPANRPHQYSARMNELMEADSNWISRVVRQIHIFIKKGVAVHYVLIFTAIGALPLFIRMAAISAQLTWIIALFFTWRFTRETRTRGIERRSPQKEMA
jgi:phosphatidylglycerophosphate synthase